ncbi:MAG TPA: hypothetical protein VKU41_30715 [Polyangiaceae bacterium]|nr:hypothetical protein [Polyangiaceae bacterium]
MPIDPGPTWVAERLLHDLAMRLCTLRFDERARALHGRVLQLERAVAEWTDEAPDDGEREAVCRELRALREDAQSWIDRIRRPTLVFPRELPRRRED